MSRFAFLLAVAVSACSTTTRSTVEPLETNRIVTVAEPLTLTVSDKIAAPGFLFARPSISVASGKVLVSSTRYGSLCRLAVSGRVDQASIGGATLTLTITFTERLTSCTAEIRSLTYDAEIKAAKGSYNVVVIHEENGQRSLVQQGTVTVP